MGQGKDGRSARSHSARARAGPLGLPGPHAVCGRAPRRAATYLPASGRTARGCRYVGRRAGRARSAPAQGWRCTSREESRARARPRSQDGAKTAATELCTASEARKRLRSGACGGPPQKISAPAAGCSARCRREEACALRKIDETRSGRVSRISGSAIFPSQARLRLASLSTLEPEP